MIAATYQSRERAKALRCEPADPVSLNVSAAALCLGFSLDYFVQFLQELSGCGDAYPEYTFTAACRNHADAVIMLAGGPWRVEMPWDCEESEGAVTR